MPGMQNTVVNADMSMEAMQAIVSEIEVIQGATTTFMKDVDEANEKCNVDFIKKVASGMVSLKTEIDKVLEDAQDITSSFRRYAEETEEYSSSDEGLI